MDDAHKSTTRKVVTFADAFSVTGGFMTVMFLVAMLVVQRLQSTIYFSSLIRSFYKYQPELLEDEDGNDNITTILYTKVKDEAKHKQAMSGRSEVPVKQSLLIELLG